MLQPAVPRIPPLQEQSGANDVNRNMIHMSTPSAGGVTTLTYVLCVARFLGRHDCLGRTRLYRHGDTHEYASLGGIAMVYPFRVRGIIRTPERTSGSCPAEHVSHTSHYTSYGTYLGWQYLF